MANIIVDTREQKPYIFPNSVRKALPAGDYSLEGLETRFVIERKSLDDWVQTLLRGKCRFRKELAKLQQYDFACIVIEGGVDDILAGNYKSDINPQALLGMTVAIMHGFHPVHVLLAGDRPHAYAMVREMLKLAEERWGKEIISDGNGGA